MQVLDRGTRRGICRRRVADGPVLDRTRGAGRSLGVGQADQPVGAACVLGDNRHFAIHTGRGSEWSVTKDKRRLVSILSK